ncbi:MAG: DUF502 domain-containing protein [Gemmatimonadota bacterium]
MRLRKQLVRLRRYLITGLIVSTPIFVTVVVLLWLFRRLDSILGPQLRVLVGRDVPGAGLVLLILFLLVVGWASRMALGRRLVAWGNAVLSRFPLTRQIYNASSQIVQSVLDREEKLFQGCALIEYPMEGTYALGFVTAAAPREVEKTVGERALSVFLPTAPNPTSGYLLVLPASRVHLLDLSVEEGLKMVVSAGVALPGGAEGRSAGLDLQRLMRETEEG